MSRREHIVGTVHRIAEVHERQAKAEVSRAEAQRREAEAAVAGLEAENAAAEAQILDSGSLGAAERELLWAHRAWYRRERVHTEERLAQTLAEVAEAQQRLTERMHETKKREKVRDHVVDELRTERFDKAQKELDEIATTRAGLRRDSDP